MLCITQTRLSGLHQRSACNRILEQLTVVQMGKKFPVPYGTKKIIIAFIIPPTGPYHEPAEFSPSSHILFFLRSAFILSSRLSIGLPT